jgi:hypothetical protein
MYENLLVLSASHGVLENGQEYASLIVASGKYSRVIRDNKTGIDAQKMRCTSELSKKLNSKRELPCLATVEFELEGAKGVPLAYDAVTYPETRAKVDAFFADLLAFDLNGNSLASNRVPPPSNVVISSNEIPSGTTPIPSGITPIPSGITPIPSGTTPIPSGITPIPSGITPIPSGTTPIPSGITPLTREELIKHATTPPSSKP